MNKAIITVIGKDTCTCLAENGVNILDISQTVREDYFNMMMIVDVSGATKPFADLGADLAVVGDALGLQIKCQKAEIFEKMHRI